MVSDPPVFKQGTFYLKLISASLPLMGFFQIFIGTFQGSGHTLSAMAIMMGRLWGLRIPLILLFKNFTNLQEKSVWFAMVLSNAIICIIGFAIYKTGRWQRKIIKKRSV
jgi:Na+-driven multidrug efflux pump